MSDGKITMPGVIVRLEAYKKELADIKEELDDLVCRLIEVQESIEIAHETLVEQEEA